MNVAHTRIICLGSPWMPGDELGWRVYERLAARLAAAAVSGAAGAAPADAPGVADVRRPVGPGDLELIDGGLAGLDLLSTVESTTHRVVFVDAVVGFASPGEAVVLGAAEASPASVPSYGHDGGLAYLLAALPLAAAGPLPEVLVVGGEGPAEEPLVERVTELSWEVALHGRA